MPPSPDHIRATVEAYLTRYPSERDALAAFFDALAAEDDLTSRKTFPMHVTCSAIVIDGSSQVLHIQHNASGKALAPGGHNEQGDQNLPGAALRELFEETGIPRDVVVPLPGFETVPLDIDVHGVVANPAKGEPAHQHVDFRWALLLRAQHKVTLQAEEVSGYEWRSFEDSASPTVRAKLALLPRPTHS
ncbi:NUDIX hydrolase [Streptomyces sp. NPDC003011]